MLEDSAIRESLAGHAERNASLVEDLKRKGLQLDATRSIEHHFWADDQKSAALLGRKLYDLGYVILVMSPIENDDGSKLWNVEASFDRSLKDAASERVTEELVRLAAQFDATYDGWGASI